MQALIWLALGGLAALGQAPWGLWYLTLLAFALAFWRAAYGSRHIGFTSGWWLGLGYFGVALFWIVEPFQVDAARHAWMAPFALVFMAAGLALFWGGAFALAARAGHAKGLAFAVTLGAMEYARANVLTGFPWALPGYIWIDLPPAQLASLIGPFGLTILTLVVAALPGAMRDLRGIAGAGLVLLAMFALGIGLSAAPEGSEDRPLVRLVQPNIPQAIKWDPERGEEFYQKHLRLSRGGPVDLVIWPESAVQWWLGEDALREAAIPLAANAPVVLGGRRFEGRRFYNTLAVIDKSGAISQRYDKRHLVPFGEYIPFGHLLSRFGIHGLAAEEGGGFSAGADMRLIALEGVGNALPLICYEAIFPRLARFEPRPDFLLQITNDAWFGEIAGPQQHFVQARFRAIEQGLPLIRAANTGISAFVDAKGGVVAALDLGTEGAVESPLPVAAGQTLYARTGDWPIIVLWLVCTGLLLRGRLTF